MSSPGRKAPGVLRVRGFLAVQAATFLAAASLHFGLLTSAYVFPVAGIAESVIGSVLAAGLLATWVRPAASRGIGLGAQGFALIGTLVGLYTILAGFGPRTTLDLAIHGTMLLELAAGLLVTERARAGPAEVSTWAA